MLYKVDVRNTRGDLLTLQLDDISDGLIVEDIAGLDPVKATITSTEFAQVDGVAYQGSTRPARNITMKIQMDPADDTPVSVLRARLYQFFMTKAAVSLRFYMTGGLQVDTDGRVEGMDAPLFAQDPEANISILCFDPDFIDIVPVVKTGLTTAAATPTTVTYSGTSETGMVISVAVAATTTEITFYQTTPGGDLKTLDFAAPMVAGDILTISTIRGDKRATLTRAGVDTSVAYGVSPQSDWLELEQGNNLIQAHATSASSPVTITYTNRYGGL